MSYCPSSGQNYEPCSQSQKISIGISADLVKEPRSRSTKDAEASVKRAERKTSHVDNQVQNVKPDFKSFGTRNAGANHVQEGSTVIRTGQVVANPPIKDKYHVDKRTSTSSMFSIRENKTRVSDSMLNQAVLQPVAGEKIETSRAISRKDGKKDVATKSYTEFLTEDNPDVNMSAKGMPQELSENNYEPCSQSQKMSIGISADLVKEPCSRSTKDAEASVKHAERKTSDLEHQVQNVKQDFRSFGTRNARADHVQEGSTVIRTGQVVANPPIKDKYHVDKRTSTSSTFNIREKKTRVSDTLLNKAVLQPVVGEKIETSRAIFRKEGKKDVATKSYTEFLTEDNPDVNMSAKGMPQELSENKSKTTLRMKLQEILGTTPSANKKYGDSKMDEVVAHEVVHVQADKGDARFKHKQSSDTIETESERAEETIRRPVTRSHVKKREPAKTRQTNLKIEPLSRDKEEYQGSHVFPSMKKSVPSKSREENLHSLRPEKFDNVKHSSGVKPVDVIHHVSDVVNIQRVITQDKILHSREELSSERQFMSTRHECLHENLEPEEATLNPNFNCSPVVREKDQTPKAECQIPPEVPNHHKSLGSQSPVHHDDDLSSPLFNMTKAAQNSPMSFFPLINEKHYDAQQTMQTERENVAGLYKYSPTTEDDTGSSDNAATPDETYATTPESLTAEEAEDGLFSPESRDSGSSEGVLPAKKEHVRSYTVYPEDVYTSPEPEVTESPILFRTKRDCSDGVDHSNPSPTTQSPKASTNTDDELMEPSEGSPDDDLMEPLEGTPEDDCARVVSLLGLAFKRVRNKMMSVTNKRCSDILTSATEEIHMQLCGVESQIQTDLGKLTSLNKAKRKHVETRLQEQQEHLKVIYENFKKEIQQYVQDCKDAAEMLEADHVELKGAIEKQKVLHKKFLLQAEAAVETQLNDAQRQIASVHKLRRQKMQKLKSAIGSCLKDGISS